VGGGLERSLDRSAMGRAPSSDRGQDADAQSIAPNHGESGRNAAIGSSIDLDFMDPALAFVPLSEALLDATCAQLVSYPDKPRPAGSQLTAEVAEGLPRRSADGRTYTFKIRPGFRFSPSNQPVTAETFKDTIERTLTPSVHSPWAPSLADVVGARIHSRKSQPHLAPHTSIRWHPTSSKRERSSGRPTRAAGQPSSTPVTYIHARSRRRSSRPTLPGSASESRRPDIQRSGLPTQALPSGAALRPRALSHIRQARPRSCPQRGVAGRLRQPEQQRLLLRSDRVPDLRVLRDGSRGALPQARPRMNVTSSRY
jgi:Bacterial extracellular solute-binding proteins, family 5 Middle